jgi:hypothetical protein
MVEAKIDSGRRKQKTRFNLRAEFNLKLAEETLENCE